MWLIGRFFGGTALGGFFNRTFYLLIYIRPLRWGHFCRLKQKYPKVRFLIRRIWKPNFPFAGEKGKYRLPMRLQRFRLLISLFKNTNPLLSLNHTLSWFSVRGNRKDRFLLSFSPRISCGGFICSALIFSFIKLSTFK